MDIKTIYPLIVPAGYYIKGVWGPPHIILNNKNFILTWAIFQRNDSMLYITNDVYNNLGVKYPNWQRQAIENLRLSMSENESFFTQYRMYNSSKLLFLAFGNKDGIGSSRILLKHELSIIFPNGYYVALPDRSYGLVIAKEINEPALLEMKNLVREMYKGAITPMSDILLEPQDFDLPAEWLEPIGNDYSNFLVSEAKKLVC